MQAIRVIYDEHRALAAVLHGMLYLVREIRYGGAQPKFDVLKAMVHYIHAFPERFHHPKEEAYLFRMLRSCSPQTAPLLDRLEAEHRASADKIRALELTLARYEAGRRRAVRAVCRCSRRLRGVPLGACARRRKRIAAAGRGVSHGCRMGGDRRGIRRPFRSVGGRGPGRGRGVRNAVSPYRESGAAATRRRAPRLVVGLLKWSHCGLKLLRVAAAD